MRRSYILLADMRCDPDGSVLAEETQCDTDIIDIHIVKESRKKVIPTLLKGLIYCHGRRVEHNSFLEQPRGTPAYAEVVLWQLSSTSLNAEINSFAKNIESIE